MKRVRLAVAVVACLGIWTAIKNCALVAAAPNDFRVTAIAAEGNNIRLTWQTVGTNTYDLYSRTYMTGTWNYVDSIFISSPTVTTTNFLHIGGATNSPARFYRVYKIVPG